MSWDLHFIDGPTRQQILDSGDFYEERTDNNETFLYTTFVNKKEEEQKSGAYVYYNKEGKLTYATVNYFTSITPFGRKMLLDFGTRIVDLDYLEGDDEFLQREIVEHNILKDDADLLWEYIIMQYQITFGFCMPEDEYVKNLSSRMFEYMEIIKKYNLYLSPINIFCLPYEILDKREKELDDTYIQRKFDRMKTKIRGIWNNIVFKFKAKDNEEDLPF